MATTETPIYKLNNGENDYYPLTVASAVALCEPIKVKSCLGGFKAGEVITVATTIYEILAKLFSHPVKEFKYDKVTIRTNKAGELYVNRDALFSVDDKTLKENDKVISVNIEELIDNNILVLNNDKITIDLSKLIDDNTLVLNKDGTISVNNNDLVRVDNDGIIKDSHGRISLNRKAIRIDGRYLVRNSHDVICFNDKYLNNFDPDFIILDTNGNYTINTDSVVTIEGNQIINGKKVFSKGIKTNVVEFDSGIISNDLGGITIKGLKDLDDETSAVSKKFVTDKFNDTDSYLNCALFESLNMKSCYEVQCNTTPIQIGTLNQMLGLKYVEEVPMGNIEVLKLRSSHSKDNMNVIVSWGDGTSTVIKNSEIISKNDIGLKEGVYVSYSDVDNEKNYYLTHIYPEVDAKYTVSIYGNTYWGIHHGDGYQNLLSRIFDSDLPICNCVKSLCSIAEGSLRLQQINLPAYFDFSGVQNFSSAFKNCLNLKRVIGFNKYIFTNSIKYSCSVFEGCKNLEYSDWHLASVSENYKKGNSSFYEGCINLKTDLVTMIPFGGFSKKIISMNKVFKDCINLICSDWNYAESVLWGDISKEWVDTEECFTGCSDNIRQNVPESWGGLKKVLFNQDVLFVRNIDDIYNLVKKLIESYDLKISLGNDEDLYSALRTIAEINKIEITLTKDSELVNALETILVSLGAKQLITLF